MPWNIAIHIRSLSYKAINDKIWMNFSPSPHLYEVIEKFKFLQIAFFCCKFVQFYLCQACMRVETRKRIKNLPISCFLLFLCPSLVLETAEEKFCVCNFLFLIFIPWYDVFLLQSRKYTWHAGEGEWRAAERARATTTSSKCS